MKKLFLVAATRHLSVSCYSWVLAESEDSARQQALDDPHHRMWQGETLDDEEVEIDEVRPATSEELAANDVQQAVSELVKEEFLAAHAEEMDRETDELLGIDPQAADATPAAGPRVPLQEIDEARVAAAGFDFDKLRGERMVIPFFIFPDGEVRPLEGKCHGFGAMAFADELEFTLGIYTEAGVCYDLMVDGRVRCHVPTFYVAVPTFYIAGKPYHFPIVGCATLNGGRPAVDPATGKYLCWETVQETTETSAAGAADLPDAVAPGERPARIAPPDNPCA